MKEFFTIKENIETEIVEKRSRFIANIFYVESKEEAQEKVQEIRKKYYDARHNCYAYSVVENNNVVQKSSDDGEPSGTAGEPILNVINKNKLQNVIIIVTRYFGGVLLGAGGLIRAYSNASINVVKMSKIIKQEEGIIVTIQIKYQDSENFKYYCLKNNINIVKAEYGENIKYIIELNEEEYKKIKEFKRAKNDNFKVNIIDIQEKGRKYKNVKV